MTMLIALALVAAQTERAEPLYVPEAEAVQTMHAFAGCIVRERTAEARVLLVRDYRTAAYNRRLRNLARSTDDCFHRGWMGMSGVAFGGALAEKLFLRFHATADPAALATIPYESRDRTDEMSHCVVRRSPAAARAVLDTAPTSPQEASALQALRPAIAECLQDADEAQFNRLGLRSLVALALFRRAELTTRTAERQ